MCIRDRNNAACVAIVIRQVLAGGDSGAAVSTNQSVNIHDKITGLLGGRGANQLPQLVDDNGFALRTIFFDAIPDKIQHDEHGQGLQLAVAQIR